MQVVSGVQSAFRYRVLGPVSATRNGTEISLGGEKQRAVFAMLLGKAGRAIDRDILLEGVWGEAATTSNRASLHTYISNLRALTGLEISRDGTAYTMVVEPDEVDRFAFENAVDEARTQLATAPDQAADLLRTALAWWNGRPYANVADIPGVQAEIRRLEELRLEAVEMRIDADLAAGRHGRLVGELEALIAEHPLRERFRFQHMLALYRSGRQTDALRAYRKAADYLGDEIGIEPSAELQDLEMRILQQDDSLRSGISQPVTQRRAFLFTDIEDSTRLWDIHPDAMGRALGRHDEILRAAIAASAGKVFKHVGDGVLAAFPTVQDAVQAAETAQRDLQGESWGVLEAVKVRMGIDVGDVDVRGEDFVGPPLNRCARIVAIGHGGQVLLSFSAQETLMRDPMEGVQVLHLGEHRLRGLAEPERIGQLVFIGLPAEFPELRIHVGGSTLSGLESGDSLRGYELREQIGIGTFGVVYRAYQPAVGREVAIKVIRPEYANHPAFVRRFEYEARLVAQLEHPHIVPLFDYWRDQDGAYLVMRLMRGGTLRPLMGDSWQPADAMKLVRQVGGALAAAHRQEVVHRDFKPANILLDDEGNAYLADFGIAARILDPTEINPLPSSAERYRAPEETAEAPTDARSDVYSLAVLTYELLTGDRVVDRPGVVSAVRPDLPQALDAVIARGSSINPGDRFVTIDDFVDALEMALGALVEVSPEPLSRTEVRNPFKGLRPFGEFDAGDFFGRDHLIETLLAAMGRQGLVSVVGPSGSGKSSAVRAGLLPALRRGAVAGSESWLYVAFTPGRDPFGSMADALESVATKGLPGLAERLAVSPNALCEVAAELLEGLEGDLMLIIDQFEETFTIVDDETTRQRFLRLLTAAVESSESRVRVLVTLRADFFDRPLGYEHIGPHVSSGHVTVIPPTRPELIEAIEKPALAVGLHLEPGLAARITSDVAEQPGGLPLMQYALTELVATRTTDVLTVVDYEEIGGVTGALGRRAEQVYRDLSSTRQEAARQILLRLVTVDENTDDTRRRAKRSELEALDIDHNDVSEVVDAFGRHRLLSFDRDATTRSPTVEVAHEALLREWPRLRGWIEEQREDLILGRRFQAAMAEWIRAGRADDYLLTGDRLAPFSLWALTASLTAEEQTFLKASRDADEAARLARRRRRRILVGVLAGATVISLAVGGFALVQRSEAREAEALAEARELAASAINILEQDPELSTLLAMGAIDANAADIPPVELVNALWRSSQWNRLIGVIEHGSGGKTFAALSNETGRLIVTSEEGAFVRAYDAASREVIWEYHEDSVDSFTFASMSSDGSRVAVGVIDSDGLGAVRDIPPGVRDDLPNRVIVLDAASGARITSLEFPDCQSVEQSAWSPDGKFFVVGSGFEGCQRDEVRHWNEVYDTETWEAVAFLASPVQGSPGVGSTLVHFDTNNRLFALTADGPAQIYTSGTFELTDTLDAVIGTGDVTSDGSLILADGPRGMAIFDSATGAALDQLPTDETIAIPWGAAFTDDATMAIIGTKGRYASVFDVGTGKLLFRLPGGQLNNWAYDDLAQMLFTAHDDGTVKIWDLSTDAAGIVSAGDTAGKYIAQNRIHVGPDLGVFVSYDFETDTPYIQLFDPADGRLLEETLEGWLAFPLSDGRFVYETVDGPWAFYNPKTGETQPFLGCVVGSDGTCEDTGEPAPYYFVMVNTANEELVAVPVTDGSTTDGRLLRFDPKNGSLIAEDPIPGGFLFARYVGDSFVIVGDSDQHIALDRTTGERLWAAKTPIGSRLSPSQRLLVFPAEGTGLGVVDTTTWEETMIGDDFGNVRGIAFSPDETKVALGNTDRLIIFDLEELTTAQVLEVPAVQSVYWIDDETLAIGTEAGVWGVVSLSTDDLIGQIRAGLRRTFTQAECARYRIDPCPTLDQIRAAD